MARPPAPFALPKPSRDTPDDDPAHRQEQNQGEQGHRHGQHRLRRVERVERDHDALPVRNREHHEQDRERDQNQRRDELLDHATSLLVTAARTRARSCNGSEARSSLPAPVCHRFGANGTTLPRLRRFGGAIEWLAHFLAGLEEWHRFFLYRDMRAGARIATHARGPIFDREGAEAPQLDPVAACHGGHDLTEYGVDDVLYV